MNKSYAIVNFTFKISTTCFSFIQRRVLEMLCYFTNFDIKIITTSDLFLVVYVYHYNT